MGKRWTSRPWAKEEDARIRQHSNDIPMLIKLLPNRTASAIYNRLVTLGVSGARMEARRPERWLGERFGDRNIVEIDRSGASALLVAECGNGHRSKGTAGRFRKTQPCAKCERIWSDDELAIMHEYAATKTSRELAKMLPGRTPVAVKYMRTRLGIAISAETRSRWAQERCARRTPEQHGGRKPRDIVGLRSGELVVLRYIGRSWWLCRCSCGRETEKRAQALCSGSAVICGKDGKRHLGEPFLKDHPMYLVWTAAKRDGLCSAWRDDFHAFCDGVLASAGERPSPCYHIKRVTDGEIAPGNAEWRTRELLVDYSSERLTLRELSERTGIEKEILRSRMARGESPEQAVLPRETRADKLVGAVFGKLTVVEGGNPILCRCECGGLVPVRNKILYHYMGRVTCPSCDQVVFRGKATTGFSRKMTSFVCEKCGNRAERAASDVKRSLRRGHKLYCGWTCGGGGNKPLPASAIAARRAGARRSGGNINAIAAMNRASQAWRYAALDAALAGREFTFEFPVSRYIFDIALHDTKTLVELDEPYHQYGNWPLYDRQKDTVAESAGWRVLRVSAVAGEVADPIPVLAALGAFERVADSPDAKPG